MPLQNRFQAETIIRLFGHQALWAYDPATGRYRATGALPFTCSDPEGDPVTTTWRFASSGPDRCTFGPGPSGEGSFELSCADPAELSGGVTRTAVLVAADASGATAAPVTWSIAVAPPP